ncbi:MAG: hypothetical protein ACLFVD_00010 [Dehalococcoidia bacterium]
MDTEWVFEYCRSAEEHSRAVKTYDEWPSADREKEFARVVSEIRDDPHFRVPDVGIGTGQ